MIRDGNVTEATEQADSLVRQAQSEIGLGLRFDTVRGLTALKAAMAEEETREAGRPTPRENGGGTGKAHTGRPIPPPLPGRSTPGPPERSSPVPSPFPDGDERLPAGGTTRTDDAGSGGGDRRPGLLRRGGDLLVLLTGADRELIGNTHERQRYVTMGLLMLLTAGLAVYTAAAIGAMGTGTSVPKMLPVGLFFAAFVLMIDRSIVSQVNGLDGADLPAPAHAPPESRPARRLGGNLRRSLMLWTRVTVATSVSLLISEVILLQIFHPRISEQLSLDEATAANARQQAVALPYRRQIDDIQRQLDQQTNVVSGLKEEYERARRETSCELTGKCSSARLSGAGAVYRASLTRQKGIGRELDRESARLSSLRRESQREIADLRREQLRRNRELDAMAGRGADLLDRERAFLKITQENAEVLFWRILLTVLLLGIDLAPVLLKAGIGLTVHDARLRGIVRELKQRGIFDAQLAEQANRHNYYRRYHELKVMHEVHRAALEEWGRAQKKNAPRHYRNPVGAGTAEMPLWPPAEDFTFRDRTPSKDQARDSGTFPTPESCERTPIMVLGGRWAVYARLEADPGACGALYRAYDVTDPERSMVAKVFHNASSTHRHYRTFLREVRGMRLEGPNIGEVIDCGEDRRSGAVYLISPHYRPGSLNLYVRQRGGRVSLRWSVWVLDQVLAGLESASTKNIIHLDVKPENVVLDGPDNIRVIDWGISRLHEAGKATSTVVPGGTEWFASPEQVGDSPFDVTGASTLYSVGALAYWLLTGMPPMRREAGDVGSDITRVRRLMEAGVRPERADRIVPVVPARLGELVDRWLSRSPRDRIPEGLPPVEALTWARRALTEAARGLPDAEVGHQEHPAATSGRS